MPGNEQPMQPFRLLIIRARLGALLLALLPGARAVSGACADCPPPAAAFAPALPVYPGAREYSESRLFFEDGFLWRAGYRAPAGAAAAAEWHRAALAGAGWMAGSAEQQQRLNEFFDQRPGVMTALRKEDVTAVVAAFPVEGAGESYVMLNIRFPWRLEGGPGSFGEAGPLYPAGRVLLRMFQAGPGQYTAYELAECPDGPGAVLPFVAGELAARGWSADRERALFSAQLGYDDHIRMFHKGEEETFAVMAVPGGAFSWHYVFLKKKEPTEKGSVGNE